MLPYPAFVTWSPPMTMKVSVTHRFLWSTFVSMHVILLFTAAAAAAGSAAEVRCKRKTAILITICSIETAFVSRIGRTLSERDFTSMIDFVMCVQSERVNMVTGDSPDVAHVFVTAANREWCC